MTTTVVKSGIGLIPSMGDYQAVAAHQDAVTLGEAGASGDYLERIILIPATTSPSAVTLTDGSNSAITIFAGGASSVNDLRPFEVKVRARSVTGAWKLTTGSNISAIAIGKFT